MTLHWLIYLLTISLLLSVAGVLVEHWARPRFLPTRTIWLIALIGSLALPALCAVIAHTPARAARTATPVSLFSETSQVEGRKSRWISVQSAYSVPKLSAASDRWLAVAWASTSLAALCWVLGTMGLIGYRRRRWSAGSLFGQRVLWSTTFGPAIVGVFRPTVVIPTWVRRLPESTQRMILEHERSHLGACDSLTLALGLAAVSAAPWNPLLWWQLRRLRQAIEVDCDRRLLRAGAEPAHYASALLDCSLKRMTLFSVNTAMAEPVSTLERRIALMNVNQAKGWTAPAILALLAAAASTFAASQVTPPPMTSESTSPLRAYAGNYRFSPVTVLNISVQGEHLVATPTNATSNELVPAGRDEFRFKAVDATLTFSRDAGGRVTSATMHQNGADTLAPRLDAAQLLSIQNATLAHIKTNQPAPGSDAALRGLIGGLRTGAPDYSTMNAQMAGGTRVMLPEFRKVLDGLGAVRALEFKGVNGDGWDQFVVQHDRGISSWEISVDERGTIVGALWHEGS